MSDEFNLGDIELPTYILGLLRIVDQIEDVKGTLSEMSTDSLNLADLLESVASMQEALTDLTTRVERIEGGRDGGGRD
jgi:hypothetical protein